jgi:hypothetical protein
MNKLDHRRILNNLIEKIDSKAKSLITEGKIPTKWDDKEITQLVADLASDLVPPWGGDDESNSKKEFDRFDAYLKHKRINHI